MKIEDLNSIVKLLIIGGIVFVALAQIIPWGQISIGFLGNVQLYDWGIQSSSGSIGTTNYYFDMVLNENTRNLIQSSVAPEGFISTWV